MKKYIASELEINEIMDHVVDMFDESASNISDTIAKTSDGFEVRYEIRAQVTSPDGDFRVSYIHN